MKQKIKQLLKIGILTFGISLLIISCSKENIAKIELTEKQQLQDKFTLKNFDDVFIKNNLVIDWDDFNINLNFENELEAYEFNTYFKVKSSIANYTKYKLLVTKNKINDWDFEIIKFSINKKISKSSLSYFTINNFTGTIHFYDLKGNNPLINIYEKGELVDKISIKDYNNINSLSKAPTIQPGYCGGCWEFQIIEHYTDWYTNTGYGGSTLYYSHSTYGGMTTEWVYTPVNGTTNDLPYDPDNDAYHNHYDYPHNGGSTENHDNEDIFEFDLNLVFYGNGLKPLYEFNNKCTGITKIWELSQNSGNEFAAVLTTDGAILITQELNPSGGGVSGIYEHNGTTYYQYPTSQGAPARTYNGQIQVAGRYFIPITATIHSHTPCINDGTDGISNNTINDDQNFATNYPSANHYIIGCNSIGQFNGNSNQAFNIQNGNLSSLCNNIN